MMKRMKFWLKLLPNLDHVKFATFPTIMNLILKVSLCSLRRISGNNSGVNAFVSGSIDFNFYLFHFNKRFSRIY